MTVRAQVYLAGLLAFFALDFAFYHAQIGKLILLIFVMAGRFAARFVTAIF